MSQPLRLLIVEDSEDDVNLLLRVLRRGDYEPAYEVVSTPEAMRTALAGQEWDVITCDHAMPHFSTPAALALAQELCPDVPFIIVSGESDLQLVVSLMKRGAQDFIPKRELTRLVPVIARELGEAVGRYERRRAEDALRVSETRYRRLFETAQDGIFILDADTGRILDANPFLVEMLGYAHEALVGKELWELGVFKDIEASKQAFAILQRDGYIRYEDLPLETRDGRHIAVEFVSNAYTVVHQHVIQCNIRDITRRTQAEAAIRQLNIDLERRVQERTSQLAALNRELEAFNYSVSHDLRAPLRRIEGFVDALQDDYATRLDAAGLALIQRIRASTQHLTALIDAFLTMTHVTRQELMCQVVDLSALAHRIADELHHNDPTRQVDWVIAEGLTTHGDAQLLRIVLDNLLSNAWKFTASRVTARIDVGAAPQAAGGVAYMVRDNGVGFDMAYADKLFGAFQRLHSDQDFPGTGIGLATVQRIIHRHGGRVWAEGAVDQGATVFFTLPGSGG